MDVTALLNSAARAADPVEGNGQQANDSQNIKYSDDDKRDGKDGHEGDEKCMELRQSPSRSECDTALSSMMTARSSENASSRRPSEVKLASHRSRTPWDAGGYSLSQALDKTKSAQVFQDTGNPVAAGTESQVNSTLYSATIDIDNKGSLLEAENESGNGSENGNGSVIFTGDGFRHGIGSNPGTHKLSDSRSSLSSAYTGTSSSVNSATHSRISSLSTVSENQPLASLITEFSHLETRALETFQASCCGASGVKHPSLPQASQIQPASHHYFHLQEYSTRGRARSNEQDARTGSSPARYWHDSFHGDRASPETSPRAPSRSQSPSDAVMIHRLARLPELQSALGSESSHPVRRAGSRAPSSKSLPGSLLPEFFAFSRHHKRAVSAPDFASVGPSAFGHRFPAFGPIPEPTPSPSQEDSEGEAMDRADSSAGGMEKSITARSGGRPGPLSQPIHDTTTPVRNGTGPMTGRSPPYNASNDLFVDPTVEYADDVIVDFTMSVCMYRGDCQTGSQLRKAISHIFGRNKLCTRMIPTGVWVHYCRKHYQRTRYRNGGEYPQRQIYLVQIQVRRVQAWSDANARAGHGPILIFWSLSVRKREQLRLEKKPASSGVGKKRSFCGDDAADVDEEVYDDDGTPENSGTAVPDWLIALIGDGYSTLEILDVVARLKQDIDEGRLLQIPDIEILPNIAADPSSSNLSGSGGAVGAKKTYTKRRTSSGRAGNTTTAGEPTVVGSHRRTQSVNTAPRPDAVGDTQRRRQEAGALVPYGAPFDPRAPQEKRQRLGTGDVGIHSVTANATTNSGPGPEPHALSGTGGNVLPRPGLGSRLQLTHRPAFGGIQESTVEHHAEHQGYSYVEDLRSAETAGSGGYHQGHLEEQEHAERQHLGFPQFPDYGRQRDDERQHFPHQRHLNGQDSTSGFSVTGPSPSRATADTSSFHGILPAPNPLRHGDASSTINNLERSSYLLETPSSRRDSMHQRAQSDAGFLHHGQSSSSSLPSQMMRSTSSSGRPAPATSSAEAYGACPISHGNNTNTGYGNGGHFTTSFQGHSFGPCSHGHSSSFLPKGSNDFRGDYDQSSWGLNEYNGRYGNHSHVQLPPLQTMQPPSQPYGPTATYYGGATTQMGSAPVYDRTSPAAYHLRHSRHQSSPVGSAKHLPAPYEAGAPSTSVTAAPATEN